MLHRAAAQRVPIGRGPPAASVGAAGLDSPAFCALFLGLELLDDSDQRVTRVRENRSRSSRALWTDRHDRQRHASMRIRCDPDARVQVVGPARSVGLLRSSGSA
jgi:hypothetical protein